MAVMQGLQGATSVMQNVNENMSVQEITTLMKNFQKEQMKAEMNNEMVQEAMDIGDANTEEADQIYDSILSEVGMEISGGVAVTSASIAGKNSNVVAEE